MPSCQRESDMQKPYIQLNTKLYRYSTSYVEVGEWTGRYRSDKTLGVKGTGELTIARPLSKSKYDNANRKKIELVYIVI